MDVLQQFQRWPKGRTTASCLRRLDNQKQLIGLGFITLRPIIGTVANHGGKQEPVTDGWTAVLVDPSVKRNPDKGCWVAFGLLPISRNGNIQLQESLREHHCLAVIGDQPLDYRDGAKSWQYKSTSLSHQLTGGSQPGGASSGVRL